MHILASLVAYMNSGDSGSLVLEALSLLPSSSLYDSIVSYSYSGEKKLVYLSRVEWEFLREASLGLVGSSGLFIAGDGLCVFTDGVQKNGVYSGLFVCVLGRLDRRVLYTSSPPRISRSNPRAVLALYVKRLLSGGIGLEELATKLVTSGGGRGAVVFPIDYESSGYNLVLVAGTNSYLCIKYRGRSVLSKLGLVEDSSYRCYSSRVVVFRDLESGIIRIESKSIEPGKESTS